MFDLVEINVPVIYFRSQMGRTDSAMVGTIGAGGIGDMAIQYGYNRYETGVLVVIVIILIVIVQIIQWIGDWFARKVTH